MNRQEFDLLVRRGNAYLDTTAFRPIDGVIRWSSSESWYHFLTKCEVVRLLKSGVPAQMIQMILNDAEDSILMQNRIEKLKISEGECSIEKNNPVVYTEARLKSGNLRTDVFLISSEEKLVAVEIADRETDKQLEEKRKKYFDIGIDFYSIRVER